MKKKIKILISLLFFLVLLFLIVVLCKKSDENKSEMIGVIIEGNINFKNDIFFLNNNDNMDNKNDLIIYFNSE